jgi:hypothetical protein
MVTVAAKLDYSLIITLTYYQRGESYGFNGRTVPFNRNICMRIVTLKPVNPRTCDSYLHLYPTTNDVAYNTLYSRLNFGI